MEKIETGMFLDNFEAEARTHIENIEAAFLDADTIAGDPSVINGVFRAAHSLKGTAGFFSLRKIVTVSHELESVFSQIKDGNLQINDEIIDIVLQSVDCLKDLIEHIHDDSGVDAEQVIGTLRKHADAAKRDETGDLTMPFDFEYNETDEALRKAVRHGQNIYYIDLSFNRSLGKYYKHPERMIDSISSVGSIAEAVISNKGDNDKAGKIIRDPDAGILMYKIVSALTERDTSILELLVTSVLDFDLFSIAIEIDKKHIHFLDKDTIFHAEDASATASAQKASDIKKTSEHENNFFIRLDISVINGLMDLANEMILTRNQLISTVSGYKKSIAGLAPVLYDMSRLASEIQEKVMLTRMQPIGVVFNKFPRIIRDTAKLLGKEIAVEIKGNDVTLDKYLLEALTDPITQLVKNSADHGLESNENRAASGKPRKGTITLSAYMRDGSVFIEVTDDGAGIDPEMLKQKALERGITTQEELLSMQANEIYNVIFEPGFSTAQQITSLSGRGVGMDIVKTNIEKLGGSIEIESEIGIGTSVRLKMPRTMSVIRALIVSIDSILYAVPELNVERIVRINGETASKRIERLNNTLILSLDGRLIPIVTMGEIEAKVKGLGPVDAGAIIERRRNGVLKCLVLKASGNFFALLIDDALESEQILVKPIPVYLQNSPCYSNVTVLGSGTAVMILDAEGISKSLCLEAAEGEAGGIPHGTGEAGEKDGNSEKDRKRIIIFRCSGPEYFSVEAGDVSRVEAIDPKHIQEVGKGYFVNVAGETIRIVRPEDYAPVIKRDYTKEKLYLLMLKKSGPKTGILTGKVVDMVEGATVIDNRQLCNDYVFGTSSLNEKIILFLNLKAITEDIEGRAENRGRG